MARVNISKQLKDDVAALCLRNRGLEESRLDGADTLHTRTQAIVLNADLVERVYFHEAPHLHGNVPDTWLQGVINLDVRVYNSDDPFVGVERNVPAFGEGYIYHNPHAKCDRPLRIPNTYHAYCVRLNLSLGHPIVQPHRELLRELFAYQKARLEIQNKWNEVAAQVHDFLDSQPSLNTALKKWEGLAHFIPASYLRRVDEAVTKRVASSDEDAVQIDTTRLEVVAVTAKLIGA